MRRIVTVHIRVTKNNVKKPYKIYRGSKKVYECASHCEAESFVKGYNGK